MPGVRLMAPFDVNRIDTVPIPRGLDNRGSVLFSQMRYVCIQLSGGRQRIVERETGLGKQNRSDGKEAKRTEFFDTGERQLSHRDLLCNRLQLLQTTLDPARDLVGGSAVENVVPDIR